MRKLTTFFVLFLLFLSLSSCQTVPKSQTENNQDVQVAVESIAEAVSGRELTEEEKKDFIRRLKSDEEAQSAVEVLTNTMSQPPVKVKYCPLTGKRYAPNVNICPEHNVKLEVVGN